LDKFTIKIDNLIDLLNMAKESHINNDYKNQSSLMMGASEVFLQLSFDNMDFVINGVEEELKDNETQEA
jgi:hypothetical protein